MRIDLEGEFATLVKVIGYLMVQGGSVLTMMEAFSHPLVTGIGASTRYIDWREKVDGEYYYTRPKVIMDSCMGGVYAEAMDNLFEAYRNLWEVVEEEIKGSNLKSEGMSEAAYETAVRGRVCDNLRKLLPLGIVNNFGLHANYRTFSELALNLRASVSGESQELGRQIYRSLSQVNPEFVGVVDSSHGEAWVRHKQGERVLVDMFGSGLRRGGEMETVEKGVGVIVRNEDYLADLVKNILALSLPSVSDEQLGELAEQKISKGEVKCLFERLGKMRRNRRHKVPGGFEGVEVVAEFKEISYSGYKDLQRHRNISWRTEPDWNYPLAVYVPEDIAAMGERVVDYFTKVQREAYRAYKMIAAFDEDLGVEARRLLTHGTKTCFKIGMGLGEAFWFSELRTIASGDPEYRWFAQQLWLELKKQMPELEWLGSFVDMDKYSVGRIGEAVRADLGEKGERWL